MEDLVRKVSIATEILNQRQRAKFRIIAKAHPARPDVIRSNVKRSLTDVIFAATQANLDSLLEQASLIVTFNSLVGFEGIQKKKPIVTLAPTFYSLPGMAIFAETLENLPDAMQRAMDVGPDSHTVRAFVKMMKAHFQVETFGATRENVSTRALHNITRHVGGAVWLTS
jgi:capsule polysaccharide modification protein KpsS